MDQMRRIEEKLESLAVQFCAERRAKDEAVSLLWKAVSGSDSSGKDINSPRIETSRLCVETEMPYHSDTATAEKLMLRLDQLEQQMLVPEQCGDQRTLDKATERTEQEDEPEPENRLSACYRLEQAEKLCKETSVMSTHLAETTVALCSRVDRLESEFESAIKHRGPSLDEPIGEQGVKALIADLEKKVVSKIAKINQDFTDLLDKLTLNQATVVLSDASAAACEERVNLTRRFCSRITPTPSSPQSPAVHEAGIRTHEHNGNVDFNRFRRSTGATSMTRSQSQPTVFQFYASPSNSASVAAACIPKSSSTLTPAASMFSPPLAFRGDRLSQRAWTRPDSRAASPQQTRSPTNSISPERNVSGPIIGFSFGSQLLPPAAVVPSIAPTRPSNSFKVPLVPPVSPTVAARPVATSRVTLLPASPGIRNRALSPRQSGCRQTWTPSMATRSTRTSISDPARAVPRRAVPSCVSPRQTLSPNRFVGKVATPTAPITAVRPGVEPLSVPISATAHQLKNSSVANGYAALGPPVERRALGGFPQLSTNQGGRRSVYGCPPNSEALPAGDPARDRAAMCGD